jgi:hypothetical protein
MLLTTEVVIRINIYNRHIYPDYNYGECVKSNTSKLPKGSGIKVSVRCDYCGFEKKIEYRKYLKNTKHESVKYSCSNKCSIVKYKETCMESYGVDNAFKLDIFKDRYKETCMLKYGVDNALKDKEFSNKMVRTKENMGIYSKNISEYKLYSNKCRSLTFKVKKEFIKNWNGYDFYDSEFILNNFNLDSMCPSYPTIDHKIPILEGFKNKIDPIEISSIENLCITKRSINSSYGGRLKNILKNE